MKQAVFGKQYLLHTSLRMEDLLTTSSALMCVWEIPEMHDVLGVLLKEMAACHEAANNDVMEAISHMTLQATPGLMTTSSGCSRVCISS